MGRADAALLMRFNAVALRQISIYGLIRSLDSFHWLLILIHINECMNVEYCLYHLLTIIETSKM